MAHIMISFYNLGRAQSHATTDLSRTLRDAFVSFEYRMQIALYRKSQIDVAHWERQLQEDNESC